MLTTWMPTCSPASRRAARLNRWPNLCPNRPSSHRDNSRIAVLQAVSTLEQERAELLNAILESFERNPAEPPPRAHLRLLAHLARSQPLMPPC